jgi:hypothetical protein
MAASAFGNSWRLLQLHVQRPGRIVTPDLLLTGIALAGADGGSHPMALQRLLLLPAIQLEQGDWAMAPALAHVRALEAYLSPAVVLLRNARPEWLFLTRQAFAAADLDGPVSVLLDGCAHDLSPAAPPQSPGVAAGVRLGTPEPMAGRARISLSARSGSTKLTETVIALEPLA